MDSYEPRELDLLRGNRRVRIHSLAQEILRNGSSVMTTLEAIRQAEQLLGLPEGSYGAGR